MKMSFNDHTNNRLCFNADDEFLGGLDSDALTPTRIGGNTFVSSLLDSENSSSKLFLELFQQQEGQETAPDRGSCMYQQRSVGQQQQQHVGQNYYQGVASDNTAHDNNVNLPSSFEPNLPPSDSTFNHPSSRLDCVDSHNYFPRQAMNEQPKPQPQPSSWNSSMMAMGKDWASAGMTNPTLNPNFDSYNFKRSASHEDSKIGPLLFQPTKKRRTSTMAEDIFDMKMEDEGDFDNDGDSTNSSPTFRPYQEELWKQRFQELCDYKEKFGHCNVSYTYTENPTLMHWVKRQRYQYKLRVEEGVSNSALTDERMKALEDIGFIWNAHTAVWMQRLAELRAFHKQHGHSNVPNRYPTNPPLSTWTKCQRRQYKLFRDGKGSYMTHERVQLLQQLDFEFEPRVAAAKSNANKKNSPTRATAA